MIEFRELWEKVKEHYMALPDEAIHNSNGAHQDDREMTLSCATHIVMIALEIIKESEAIDDV